MNYKNFKRKLLKNTNYQEARVKNYKNSFYRIGRMITEARVIRGMSQNDLAQAIKTKQPAIARLENGSTNVSIGLLLKIAKALKTELIPPKFLFMKDIEEKYDEIAFSNIDSYETFNLMPQNSKMNLLTKHSIDYNRL